MGAGTDLGAYGRSGSAERDNFLPGSVSFSPRENGTIKTCGIASYELFEGFIFLDHQKVLKTRGAASITEFQSRNLLKPLLIQCCVIRNPYRPQWTEFETQLAHF